MGLKSAFRNLGPPRRKRFYAIGSEKVGAKVVLEKGVEDLFDFGGDDVAAVELGIVADGAEDAFG